MGKCVLYLPFRGTTAGWLPRKIELIKGVDFYLVGKAVNSIMHIWIYFLGSPLEAKNYAYTLSIEGKNGTKYSFYDHVIPSDERTDNIIAKQQVFMIGTEVMSKFSDENSKLPVE